MKANELRIGNLVYDGNEVMIWTDTSFYHITVSQKLIEDYKPIPLTEDWLIKFGFKNLKHCDRYFKHAKISGGIFIGSNNSTYKYTNIIIEINSVHQLQNLYFALTREELEIK